MMYNGNDRVQQVDALRQLANDIYESLPVETSAEDISRQDIDWMLDEADPHAEPLPDWFDDYCRNSLLNMVREKIAGAEYPLSTLAELTGLEHHQLRVAAIEGRLEAHKVGYMWVASLQAVEEALADGGLQTRPGRPSRRG